MRVAATIVWSSMSPLKGRRPGRRFRGRFGGRWVLKVGVVIVVILLAWVWIGVEHDAAVAATDAPSTINTPNGVTPAGVVAGKLVVTNQTYALSPQFFGVNVHAVGVHNQSLAALVNATPFVAFRFSPLGEATDQVHAVTYSQNGVPSASYAQTDAEFVTWCHWIHCRATMMVPAEIDNATEAAATIRYVEQTLGFHPTYWAIGNEPQEWTHWGIAWPDWRSTDTSTPTPTQYAVEVQQYVVAMRDVDPNIRIIGIESTVGGTLAGAWLKDLLQVDGPNLTAVAYHAYPLGTGNVPASLATFYNALTNPLAFPLNYPETESIIHATCPSCKLSVFVDELNAGLGGNFSSYMTGYPEVPFISAALITAMQERVDRVLFFDLEDLDGLQPYGLTTVGHGARPSDLLFSDFIDHMAAKSVLESSIVGGPGRIYEVLTTNSNRTSLFVVNTNLTDALSLTLPTSMRVFAGPLTEYSWAPPASDPATPVRVSDPNGTAWKVPPQGVLLLVWDQG